MWDNIHNSLNKQAAVQCFLQQSVHFDQEQSAEVLLHGKGDHKSCWILFRPSLLSHQAFPLAGKVSTAGDESLGLSAEGISVIERRGNFAQSANLLVCSLDYIKSVFLKLYCTLDGLRISRSVAQIIMVMSP